MVGDNSIGKSAFTPRRGVEALLQIELSSNFSNVGRKNMLFQWTKNPRPSLYNISAKNHLNWLQNPSFERLFLRIFSTIFGFSSIFDQLLLFDHKQICI